MAGARNEVLIAAFAAELKRARLGAKLTQEELAGRAEIDRTFVGLLENGNRQPSLSVFFAIAHAVNQTPQALLGKVCAAAKVQPTVER